MMGERIRLLRGMGTVLLMLGCGGANLHFDAAPAPSWIRTLDTHVAATSLRAVGQAPVTTNVQRDLELAAADAKRRIAQMFVSEVTSRSSDWSLAVGTAETTSQHVVAQQSIEVRSQLKIEEITLEHSYRDEASKAQYVQVTVDRTAWLARVEGRLQEGLKAFSNSLALARSNLGGGRPLAAYEQIIEANQRGRALEADVLVADLMARERGFNAKLGDLKEQLDGLKQGLRDAVAFTLRVDSPDPEAARVLKANLEQFLAGRGFRTAGGGKTIVVKASINQRYLKTEQVADRKEFVHAAEGELKVAEPDGSTVAKLTVKLDPSSYTERDVNKKEARRKTMALAVETLAAKFRSTFRNLYAVDE